MSNLATVLPSQLSSSRHNRPELTPEYVYMEDGIFFEHGDEYWDGKKWVATTHQPGEQYLLSLPFPYRRLRKDFLNF